MQDYREIDRIRKDTVAVHSLAKRLLNTPNHEWNDWELDFLEHMARHRGPNPITTRQGEKLIELRDGAEYHSSVQGFSVASLITNCWAARDDLNSEQDKKFIEDLKASGVSAIRKRQLGKLLACARELGEVEKYIAIGSKCLRRLVPIKADISSGYSRRRSILTPLDSRQSHLVAYVPADRQRSRSQFHWWLFPDLLALDQKAEWLERTTAKRNL